MKRIVFHPLVQQDIIEAMEYYTSVSSRVADRFWEDVQAALTSISQHPTAYHFDETSGLRRLNLTKFPYNLLFLIKTDRVRIQVIRHNSRNPKFGTKRTRAE